MGSRARISRRHTLAGAALLTASFALSHPASAQSLDDRAGARAAAGEGTKALREGRWADAIDLFTRAESLVHAPPHLLYMARAQVEVGMLVEARENLMRVSREALAPDAPRAFKMAQDEAAAEIKGVEARIPYVTVTVKGGGASDVGVTQDGNKVPSALIGVPRPVNPGQHTFEAVSSSGKATASITIKEAERQRVILDLASGSGSSSGGGAAAPPKPAGGDTKKPPEEKKPAVEAKASTGSSASPAGAAPGPAPEADQGGGGGGGNGMRIGSYISFGVGGVGLIAGTIFALGAKSKYDEANDLFTKENCGGQPVGCSRQTHQKIDDLDSSASGQKTLSLVGFIVGGLGIAGGVTLFVLSGNQSSEKAATRPAPTLRVAGAPGFVSLTGTF